jgi:hypothetical protein
MSPRELDQVSGKLGGNVSQRIDNALAGMAVDLMSARKPSRTVRSCLGVVVS